MLPGHALISISSSYLGALKLLLPLPQVLLVVVQPVVDSFGQVGGDLGSGLVVACAVAAGVFADVGRSLGDDEDLVDVLVVQLVVRVVVVRPVAELVLPGRHLLHLLVEHEVQLLLVGLGLLRGAAARGSRLTALLEDTVDMRSSIHKHMTKIMNYRRGTVKIKTVIVANVAVFLCLPKESLL